MFPAADCGWVKQVIGAALVIAAVAACASAQSNDPSNPSCPPTDPPSQAAPPVRTRPLVTPIPIEDPSGHAMQSFHAALRAAEEKRGQARIVYYGASHVAADIYTDVIRTRLQARFGEAGIGFVLPARPLPHYRNSGISFDYSKGWSGVHVKPSDPIEDYYGLAGTYVVPAGKRPARSAFSTRSHDGVNAFASIFELYYWKQPDGGRLRLKVDNKTVEIKTASRTAGPAYERLTVPDGPHHVELATRGDGQVRIFGMAMDRDKPGVILDTLGIPGSRAKTHLLWDEPLYREHLARRRPDLVVLAYGTNESGDDDQPIEEYEAELRRVVERVRETVPKASCLLVGPSDRPKSTDGGAYSERPRTAQIVQTQREVANQFGCGFFDLVAFMGGPMSMLDWCDGVPPLGASDHVHFTRSGYEALGNVLYDALLTGYRAPAPVVLGPRPIAPPGSSVSELNQPAHQPRSEPRVRSRRHVTSQQDNRRSP
jgi:lysophospholipase L1-like esterase